jgi:hypothetical protein
VETIRENGEIRYRLTGDGVGRRAQTDLFFTHFTPGHFREDVAEGQPARRGMFAMVEQPTKRLVFDMFLHREVWPGRPLQLAIYDTAVHGLCNPNNPKHAQRRLDIAESIEELGFGLTRARHAHLPRYLEALEHVAAARGWQPSAFRGYRCEILYPMYGSQVCMGSVLEHRTDS